MIAKEFSKIFEMSVDERILLVEEIWDSIAENPEAVPLTKGQLKELERRLDYYHTNPGAGTPWPEAKKRILSAK